MDTHRKSLYYDNPTRKRFPWLTPGKFKSSYLAEKLYHKTHRYFCEKARKIVLGIKQPNEEETQKLLELEQELLQQFFVRYPNGVEQQRQIFIDK